MNPEDHDDLAAVQAYLETHMLNSPPPLFLGSSVFGQLPVLADESSEPETWQWCSYADDDGFRGVVIVRARGVISATAEVSRLGLSPGGQVVALPFPPGYEPGEFAHRLLTAAEAEAAGLAITGIGTVTAGDI